MIKEMNGESLRSDRPTWQVQEARAEFSRMLDEVQETGYEVITREGEEVAVVMSMEGFNELVSGQGSLLEFFRRAPCADIDLPIERSRDLARGSD